MNAGPLVTVVLATYNRPDALQVAIRSVFLQTVDSWRLLVVGDHCDDRTAKVVGEFADPRVRYVNLPVRAGEQSGPNSVGIALARTPFIAFLNHDDIWLKDHLATGLEVLETSGVDFFLGKAAIAYRSRKTQTGAWKPLFDGCHGDDRHPGQSCDPNNLMAVEPASAWMIRTGAARRVGCWESRNRLLAVYPIQDWVRRAWRLGLRFAYGPSVTVLKLGTHTQPEHDTGIGFYRRASHEHWFLLPRLEALSSDEFRKWIALEILRRERQSPPWFRQWSLLNLSRLRSKPLLFLAGLPMRLVHRALLPLLNPVRANLYRSWGIDLQASLYSLVRPVLKNSSRRPLQDALLKRTGESLAQEIDIDTIVRLTVAAEQKWTERGSHRPTPFSDTWEKSVEELGSQRPMEGTEARQGCGPEKPGKDQTSINRPLEGKKGSKSKSLKFPRSGALGH